MRKNVAVQNVLPERLVSVDAFRGVVMLFLLAETTGLYELLNAPAFEGTIFGFLAQQFRHHPWHGLRLWDLGQPLFMFISGVAMVLSYERRWQQGESWRRTLGHAARRALVLFSLGWALSEIDPLESGGRGEFLLDILPQLALAGFLGFLLMKRPVRVQAGFALGLLLITEFLYRLWLIPGFDQPFIPGRNFGSYLDMTLFGRLSEEHWVTFSIVPSIVFVFAGSIAGRLLMRMKNQSRLLGALIVSGLLGIALGLSLDIVTPIIRRICTSSFVVLSVGISMLALAFVFWLINIVKVRKGMEFVVCVGMNSIFIYVFAVSGGGDWLRRLIEPFILVFSGWIGGLTAQALVCLGTWGLMWFLCRWLYVRKIFIKI